jgi:hypothetical protein
MMRLIRLAMSLSAECPIEPRAATAISSEPEELVAHRSAMPLVACAIKIENDQGLEWRRGSARERTGSAASPGAGCASAASLCQAATQVPAVKRAIFLKLRLTRRVF